MLHEFNKCRFCTSFNDATELCADSWCQNRSDYCTNVNAILNKADALNVSVTDILNLISDCNEKKLPQRLEY